MFVVTEAVVSDSGGENKGAAADVSASQHVMVCALKELGSLVQSLSATAAPLIQEPSIGKKESQTGWEPEPCFSNTPHTSYTTHSSPDWIGSIMLAPRVRTL